MTDTAVVQPRIVPGAPPPVALSKSQKKKRRVKGRSEEDGSSPTTGHASGTPVPDATFTEKSPGSDTQEGALAPEPVSRSGSQAPLLPEEDVLLKHSPIVDLVNKRLKATTKKIARISAYASTDLEKLNDDQKRSIKNLQMLDAIVKELGEVKKAIEVHEHELAQELSSKRLEAEKAERTRIADAVSATEATLISETNNIFDLLRLRSLLNSGAVDASTLADSSEISALFSLSDILVGDDAERRRSCLDGLLRGAGDFGGVSYARLLAMAHQPLSVPRVISPPPEEFMEDQPPVPSVNGTEEEEEEEEGPPVTGVPNPSASMTGSLLFIQKSEIEASFEEGAEWVEKSDATGHEGEARNTNEEPEIAVAESAENVKGSIDWAADEEGGLPSIAGLQAEFGNSDSTTPEDEGVHSAPTAEGNIPADDEANANGHHPTVDEDGFVQAKGRGRGRGGPRGDNRGHGDRGFHRGRVGDRGAHRGDRGGRGYRGGERGGYRGGRGGGERGGERGRGEWRGEGGRERGEGFEGRERGEWRGDGERGRGGGRGRGRGDRGGHHHHHHRDAPPATPV